MYWNSKEGVFRAVELPVFYYMAAAGFKERGTNSYYVADNNRQAMGSCTMQVSGVITSWEMVASCGM